ncbi:hypothetical protein G6F37_000823 [Rhizopus arrhizus]|nr:hypothetical protein G6F38_004301 [Rhizopus arrhizus]KAG1163854.1 hypothetical protein G6F37_000823 [Rhizopus arrhizus]
MPKNSKAKKFEDDSLIPRPLNCFLLYRIEKQKEIVAKCPGANHRDISKIIAKWWTEATEEEKRPFREQARIAKQEHYKMYPTYKYAPKKKETPKRAYNRKNKNQTFTSRSDENNKFMEMIYNHAEALEVIQSSDAKSGVKKSKTLSTGKNKKATRQKKEQEESVSIKPEFFGAYSPSFASFESPHYHPNSFMPDTPVSMKSSYQSPTMEYNPFCLHDSVSPLFTEVTNPYLEQQSFIVSPYASENDFFSTSVTNDTTAFVEPIDYFNLENITEKYVDGMLTTNMLSIYYPAEYINPMLLCAEATFM